MTTSTPIAAMIEQMLAAGVTPAMTVERIRG
jgi:hypothetical protein